MTTQTIQSRKEELGRRYEQLVGYNPFEDDASITVEEVEEMLEGFLEEVAAHEGAK